MWKVISSKMFWLYGVLVVLLIGFFSFAQVGARNSTKVKQVPVALVNSSNSKQSQQIAKKLQDKFSDADAQIDFITVKHESQLKKGFTDKKYYAAVVIDASFDQNLTEQQNYLKGLIIQKKLENVPAQAQSANPQVKAQSEFAKKVTAQMPGQAKIKVITNQGMNTQAASLLTTALPKIGEGLGNGIATQMQSVLSQNKVSLDASQWKALSQPIAVTTTVKNKIPDKSISGMAPMILIVLSWIGSMIASILLWREHKKHSENGRFNLPLINSQMITGVVIAVISSLSIFFFAHVCFGMPVPDPASFIGLLFFNILVFYLIQTCILDWAGFAGWPLIMIVWLLSAAVVSYPKEMLSPLFRNGVYSWTPMRFSIDMFTNNLYIHGSSITTQTDFIVLGSIGIAAIVLIYLSSLLKRTEK